MREFTIWYRLGLDQTLRQLKLTCEQRKEALRRIREIYTNAHVFIVKVEG